MGIFGKKVPVNFVFVGKCRARTAMPERQYPKLLKPLLADFMRKQLGDNSTDNPKFVRYFGEWSDRVYSPETIRYIEKNGIGVFSASEEVRYMLDEIDNILVQRFGCTMDNHNPACLMLSDNPFSGLFAVCWTQNIKEKRLEG